MTENLQHAEHPGKLKHELKAVILVTLFFAAWLGIFMALKILILEGYPIRFGSVSAVLIGALVLAKVVLILEHVPLGAWVPPFSPTQDWPPALSTAFTPKANS